jgi:hypothetical protein
MIYPSNRRLRTLHWWYTEDMNNYRCHGSLFNAFIYALFGMIVGLFALARTSSAPIEIEAFVNNNLRGLFGLERVG